MDISAKARPRAYLFWVLLFLALTIAATLAIWSFSLEDGRASTLTSNSVLRFLEARFGNSALMKRVFGLTSADRYTVQQSFRKLAHFIEYALLGVILQCLLAASRRMNGHNMLHTVSLALFIALIDETIQMGVDRGAALTDVWLDFVGVLFGCCVIWMVYGATRVFARR